VDSVTPERHGKQCGTDLAGSFDDDFEAKDLSGAAAFKMFMRVLDHHDGAVDHGARWQSRYRRGS